MPNCRIIINEECCKGCELCVMFCPKGVLEVDKVLWKVKVVKPEDCICCKKCEEMCPDFAIFILDN